MYKSREAGADQADGAGAHMARRGGWGKPGAKLGGLWLRKQWSEEAGASWRPGKETLEAKN